MVLEVVDYFVCFVVVDIVVVDLVVVLVFRVEIEGDMGDFYMGF